jgi:hypothetical protein
MEVNEMSKSLDFNKLKKQYLTVTLADEEKTVLMITTPTKNILDDFLSMKDSLSDENIGEEALNELYNIVAKILSRNKAGIEISPKKVKDTMDFEDVIILIRAYTDFISEVSNSKN